MSFGSSSQQAKSVDLSSAETHGASGCYNLSGRCADGDRMSRDLAEAGTWLERGGAKTPSPRSRSRRRGWRRSDADGRREDLLELRPSEDILASVHSW